MKPTLDEAKALVRAQDPSVAYTTTYKAAEKTDWYVHVFAPGPYQAYVYLVHNSSTGARLMLFLRSDLRHFLNTGVLYELTPLERLAFIAALPPKPRNE